MVRSNVIGGLCNAIGGRLLSVILNGTGVRVRQWLPLVVRVRRRIPVPLELTISTQAMFSSERDSSEGHKHLFTPNCRVCVELIAVIARVVCHLNFVSRIQA